MFQIAAVYSLAIDHRDECAFPLDRTEMGQGCQKARTYTKTIFKHVRELPRGWRPAFTYLEPYLNGLPDLTYRPIPYRPNMQVKGYFPCEKYFINHKQKVLELFMDIETINGLRSKFGHLLPNSVSFHVRRGDYLKNPSVIPIAPKNYYIRALTLLENNVKVDNILVFSDDMPWCKRNFSDKRITFIEGQKDYEDLYLMSLCTNNIICRSGFSWWGSYMNQNPSKIIYAPFPWFGSDGVQGYMENYTTEMIKI
jgi:hypothetical protein